jgi:HPt (histidine-containing phosphotransfer) domain-containing protein
VGSSEGGVDPAALERLREQIGSGDALEHIVALFRSQTPEKLEKLGASVGSGDRKAVTEAAHFLKGSAASLGAVRMAELCQQLETNSPARSPELLEALNGAFDEAVFALEGRLGPSGDESGSHGH